MVIPCPPPTRAAVSWRTGMLPDTAWIFNSKTIKYNVEGWSQGAYKEFGKGKIVVFGEAAMFTAQLAGPQKIKAGMNNEVAPENYKLLLNIIHWLDGRLTGDTSMHPSKIKTNSKRKN